MVSNNYRLMVRRILAVASRADALCVVVVWILLATGQFPVSVVWIVGSVVTLLSFYGILHQRRSSARPLQTLANIVAALREGDTSVRARSNVRDEALDQLTNEINTLADLLKAQRLGQRETSAMLDQVIREIDVGIFAFDGEDRLRLINRAGASLLQRNPDEMLNQTATELGLVACLDGPMERTLEDGFFAIGGRWHLHRSPFRQEGLPHQLLVLTDLSRALRKEEQQAWQRLIRVLSHELNNSLAPIKSLAGTLLTLVQKPVPLETWREDLCEGLDVIASRAESLNRFLASYASLARLPAPHQKEVSLTPLIKRIVELDRSDLITLKVGPDISLLIDADQIEQVLVNLLKNAVEAANETSGKVELTWRIEKTFVLIEIRDEGLGISGTANLFVPFFTTKEKGSGIGLVLSRQIAEGHSGSLSLENRNDRVGCVACLALPLKG